MINIERIRVSAIDDGKTYEMTVICQRQYAIIQTEGMQAIIERGEINMTQAWKLFETLTIFAKHEPKFTRNLIRAMKGDTAAFDKIGLTL